MPSVYDYRHIELDRVGSGKKRIIKPPGGESADIFGRKLPASPNGSVISASPPSSPGSSAPSSAPSTPRRGSLRMEDTKNRLFGPAVTPSRKIKDHMKSSIFSAEDTPDSPTPSVTPSRRLGPIRRNPITGEILETPGSTTGSVYESDGLRSPDTASLVNGHSGHNYTNGSSNGCSETCSEAGSEGGSNASLSIPSTPVTRKVRQPPGGKCSALW